MKKDKLLSRRSILLAAVMLVGMLDGIKPVSAYGLEGQGQMPEANTGRKQMRHVGKDHSYPDEPVEIAEIKIKGSSLELNSINKHAKFFEDDKWLRRFGLKVKNISGKPIIYIEFYLSFADPNSSENILVYPFRYGRDPKLPNAAGEDKLLMPGSEDEFLISDDVYDGLRRTVEKKAPLSSIKKIGLQLYTVKFDDDTAWASGFWFRRDANDPQKWQRIQD